MPSYKLTYFDFRARGEIARYIFAAANVPYEDERIAYGTDAWDKAKKGILTHKVPVLYVDGKFELNESMAIGYYLAQKHGLAGDTDEQRATAHACVLWMHDFMEQLAPIYVLAANSAEKKVLIEKMNKELVPVFDVLVDMLKKNGNTFFVGCKMTWADLMFLNCIDWIESASVTFDKKKFSTLVQLNERLRKRPELAKYLSARKKTPL